MKVFFFGLMLILVYVLCCASIAKQQKIRILNLKPWWGITFLHDVDFNVSIELCKYYEIIKDSNPKNHWVLHYMVQGPCDVSIAKP